MDEYPNSDAVISAYLTLYVNGLMCAEIESVISELIQGRIESGCSDEVALSAVRIRKLGTIRSARIDEVRKTLKQLGSEYVSSFNELVDQSLGEEGKGRLGTAVRNRNETAHRTPPDITFADLEKAYDAATKMVDAVRATLED